MIFRTSIALMFAIAVAGCQSSGVVSSASQKSRASHTANVPPNHRQLIAEKFAGVKGLEIATVPHKTWVSPLSGATEADAVCASVRGGVWAHYFLDGKFLYQEKVAPLFYEWRCGTNPGYQPAVTPEYRPR